MVKSLLASSDGVGKETGENMIQSPLGSQRTTESIVQFVTLEADMNSTVINIIGLCLLLFSSSLFVGFVLVVHMVLFHALLFYPCCCCSP